MKLITQFFAMDKILSKIRLADGQMYFYTHFTTHQ